MLLCGRKWGLGKWHLEVMQPEKRGGNGFGKFASGIIRAFNYPSENSTGI